MGSRQGASPQSPPETIPVPFAFTAARYDGRLTDRLITFTAQLDLLTGGADAWRSVPVPFRGVKLTSLTLDGETAVMKGADVLVEKPGRHRLTAIFEIPFARGATEFRWGIPPSAATLVTLKLPDPAMSATIAPGSGSVEHLVDGVKEVVGRARDHRRHPRHPHFRCRDPRRRTRRGHGPRHHPPRGRLRGD